MHELLKLSYNVLMNYFENKETKVDESIKKKYSKKQACFITILQKSNNELRGCIGSIYPKQELYKDVIDNTLNATFRDPRFLPLEKEDLSKIKIKISILSIPKKIDYKNENDLKKKINHKGVILKKGIYSATFLPDVWHELSDPDSFLEHLSMKAGLSITSWKNAEYLIYESEIIE